MKTNAALSALAALAQPSRLAIFRYLVELGPQGSSVAPIAESQSLPAATLSFHLKELSQARLIYKTQEGRFVRYRVNFDVMIGLIDYLTENCCGGDPSACSPVCTPAKVDNAARSKRK